jgi:hypothetical protein
MFHGLTKLQKMTVPPTPSKESKKTTSISAATTHEQPPMKKAWIEELLGPGTMKNAATQRDFGSALCLAELPTRFHLCR